jgi:hypothetical protein
LSQNQLNKPSTQCGSLLNQANVLPSDVHLASHFAMPSLHRRLAAEGIKFLFRRCPECLTHHAHSFAFSHCETVSTRRAKVLRDRNTGFGNRPCFNQRRPA